MRKLDFKSLTMFVMALVMVMMTAALSPARADDDPFGVLNKIKAAGVLKAPVMVGEEPGYIKDPTTGEWSGFYVEWANEIAELLGVKVEPVETTWGNIAADFQAGKIDLAIGLNPNPKRGLVVDYLSVPLFTDAWALSVPAGSTIKNWSDLNDPKLTDCTGPDCDGEVRRLLGTGGGILFKGAGFYQTDYRSSSYQAGAKAEGGSAPKSEAPAAAPAAPAAKSAE